MWSCSIRNTLEKPEQTKDERARILSPAHDRKHIYKILAGFGKW